MRSTSIAGNSQDFYGADNSIAHRLAEMLALPQLRAQPFLVPFAFAAMILAMPLSLLAYRRSPIPRPQCLRAIVVFLGFTGFLALYMLWELFFYNGRLPSGIRYDFPILLLPPSIALGFAAFVRYTLLPGGGWRWRCVQLAFLALTVPYLYRSNLTVFRARRGRRGGRTDHGIPPRLQCPADGRIGASGLAYRPGAEPAVGL